MTKMAVTFLLSLSPTVTDDLKTLRGQAECPLPLFPFKAVSITSLHVLRSVTLAQNSDVPGCTKWGEGEHGHQAYKGKKGRSKVNAVLTLKTDPSMTGPICVPHRTVAEIGT